MIVKNPHDKFFYDSFGRPEIARNFLEEYLPAEIRQLLNLEHLVWQKDKFHDSQMHEYQSDLLYLSQLLTGEAAYIYLLFEHKSYVDNWVAFQTLEYMVRIWAEQKKLKQPFSPVIPIVIYHGEQPWRVSTEFLALFDMPEALRPYMPNFRYHLSDFSHHSEEKIRGRVWLRVTLAVLRAIFDPRLREQLPHLVSLIFELRKQKAGLEYIRTILYYVTRATGKVSRQDLRAALLQQGPLGERTMMTIAEAFIQEGFERGKVEGKQEGRQEGRIEGFVDSALTILQARFGHVPQGMAPRLMQVEGMDVWQRLQVEAAVCGSLQDFEQLLNEVSPTSH